jgi:hypothetical protein
MATHPVHTAEVLAAAAVLYEPAEQAVQAPAPVGSVLLRARDAAGAAHRRAAPSLAAVLPAGQAVH